MFSESPDRSRFGSLEQDCFVSSSGVSTSSCRLLFGDGKLELVQPRFLSFSSRSTLSTTDSPLMSPLIISSVPELGSFVVSPKDTSSAGSLTSFVFGGGDFLQS